MCEILECKKFCTPPLTSQREYPNGIKTALPLHSSMKIQAIQTKTAVQPMNLDLTFLHNKNYKDQLPSTVEP